MTLKKINKECHVCTYHFALIFPKPPFQNTYENKKNKQNFKFYKDISFLLSENFKVYIFHYLQISFYKIKSFITSLLQFSLISSILV